MDWSRNEPISEKWLMPSAGLSTEATDGFHGCPCCGAGPLQERSVSSVFWLGEKALMVRGVPAMVCTACGEDFISHATATELDRIRGAGFNGSVSDVHVSIPVFDFGKISA